MALRTLEEAQQRLGYRFSDLALLEEALTHKSFVNESSPQHRKHNERLEFLGDAVLALIINETLIRTFPQTPEGDLSKMKARLVSEPSLARAARRLNLGEMLQLGRGEELTHGRQKASLLANALEAILAAVYLDSGLEAARRLILRVLGPDLQEVRAQDGPAELLDFKTQVQEWCQKRGEGLPHYVMVRESGPDHQKTFQVQLRMHGDVYGSGIGRTKKEAEQMAAQEALTRLLQRPGGGP